MSEQKTFLTYNQQMRKLRNQKGIQCTGPKDKSILVRTGYFNIVNGYKGPFTCGSKVDGSHQYLPNTTLEHLYGLKEFDDKLRLLLLRCITQIEEEVRTLTGYKFDQCNNEGKIPWYDTNAYSLNSSLQSKMSTISAAYSELSRSQLDYVKFYMSNHASIPTWIMIKVINFSTFIDVLKNSKATVTHSICKLYNMKDEKGLPNVKLLIGSLHWMRKVRNSCAHNERIYCIKQSKEPHRRNTGRIIENYISSLRASYSKDSDKRIMDLLIYFKYYLPHDEYKKMMQELQFMLKKLEGAISANAFENIRGQMGIKHLEDLEELLNFYKEPIQYNKFDSLE